MDSNLGLNEHHYNALVSFLRFAKYQRSKRIRAIEGCFQDVRESRLQEDVTYTMEEVQELLEDLYTLVRGEVETELVNCVHTNVLLLRQLYSQAQQWHLRLQADISELENKDLLEKVSDFEERELTGIGQTAEKLFASLPTNKLEPLVEGLGPTKLLQKEIETLQEENKKIKEHLKQVESQTISILEEKSRLKQNLMLAESKLEGIQIKQGDVSGQEELIEQISHTKKEMEETLLTASATQIALEQDMGYMNQKLLETQSQLELAEQELEKKFSQTMAYSNMKKMLTSKNNQIKELRKELAKYESAD